MGSTAGRPNERPVHTVVVATFHIARTETTVEHYRACVRAGKCKRPRRVFRECNYDRPQRDAHPVNCVTWHQANAFCRWLGGCLPTEAEWEFAARSRGRLRAYPWGHAKPSCALAVFDQAGDGCGKGSTWPVCSKPKGRTLQGVCDMAGNVQEWVHDRYSSSYYSRSPRNNPRGASHGNKRAFRGGSFELKAPGLRTTVRSGALSFGSAYGIGFRCAR